MDVSKSDDEQNSPICPVPSGKSDIATENLQKTLRSTNLQTKDTIQQLKNQAQQGNAKHHENFKP